MDVFKFLGTVPSCSSTPPPAFDDISEHGSSSRNYDERGSSERRVHVGSTIRSTTYREDTVRWVKKKIFNSII